MTARPLVACAIAALLAAVGCGAERDRTGNPVEGKPVVLTLVQHDDGAKYVQDWADAVAKRSGGSVRIRVVRNWRKGEVGYERAALQDVRSGKVPLALVWARAYDEVGVTSLQPLAAPLLIDGADLQRRVLRDDLAARALRGVEKLDLVGLALLPGDLRWPVGLGRELRGPRDYRGIATYVREGAVARATLEALGARPSHGPSETWPDGVGAAEMVLGAVVAARKPAVVTGNVALWASPVTVVMNRRAYERLSADQRKALEGAAEDAFEPESRLVDQIASEEAGAICRGAARVVDATPAQLAALRSAVQPVYAMIERGPGNRAALERIAELKGDAPADAVKCSSATALPPEAPAAARELEGTYRTSFTEQELATSDLLMDGGELNDENWGELTLRLRDGRFTLDQRNKLAEWSYSGTYRTKGKLLTMQSDERFSFRWSLYQGTLVLERDPEHPVSPTSLVIKPWRRMG